MKQSNSDYIFGIRAVIEAIDAGKSIDKVLLRKDLGGDLARELFAKIKEYGILTQRVPLEKLNRITMKNHQGVIALISPVTYHHLDNLLPSLFEEGKNPFLLVLDGITDTRNFGAIGRTADCAGADGIVIPERNSVSVTPDAVKTSAGGLFYVPVCRERDIVTAVRMLKDSGVKVVAASEKAASNYSSLDFTVPVAIVMGSEDVGISDEVLRLCDELAAIPMSGNIGSLNVSVAAGIMAYEVVRQRLKADSDLAISQE
ncbi:MAG: 23S rRNA (guanosine(2251)-2'-O)-methyltransferase RlmB [Muribaculaceae bacterium]|nr:23S rRNA (guanosine(2251)-2'-O)-methyltransferase RlmB [Muribaculaceae bacterium]